jgi:hypothetical protein
LEMMGVFSHTGCNEALNALRNKVLWIYGYIVCIRSASGSVSHKFKFIIDIDIDIDNLFPKNQYSASKLFLHKTLFYFFLSMRGKASSSSMRPRSSDQLLRV